MKITVSKIDVARSQLETAIGLFFNNRDPISIHTLVRAAHEILEAIAKKQGVNSVLEEGYKKSVPSEKIKIIKDKLNEVKNFSKHGNADANKTVDFRPELNIYFLYDAARLYHILTKNLTKDMGIFQVWFFIKNPYVLSSEQQEGLDITFLRNTINIENKEQFYTDLSKSYEEFKKQGKL